MKEIRDFQKLKSTGLYIGSPTDAEQNKCKKYSQERSQYQGKRKHYNLPKKDLYESRRLSNTDC